MSPWMKTTLAVAGNPNEEKRHLAKRLAEKSKKDYGMNLNRVNQCAKYLDAGSRDEFINAYLAGSKSKKFEEEAKELAEIFFKE